MILYGWRSVGNRIDSATIYVIHTSNYANGCYLCQGILPRGGQIIGWLHWILLSRGRNYIDIIPSVLTNPERLYLSLWRRLLMFQLILWLLVHHILNRRRILISPLIHFWTLALKGWLLVLFLLACQMRQRNRKFHHTAAALWRFVPGEGVEELGRWIQVYVINRILHYIVT